VRILRNSGSTFNKSIAELNSARALTSTYTFSVQPFMSCTNCPSLVRQLSRHNQAAFIALPNLHGPNSCALEVEQCVVQYNVIFSSAILVSILLFFLLVISIRNIGQNGVKYDFVV